MPIPSCFIATRRLDAPTIGRPRRPALRSLLFAALSVAAPQLLTQELGAQTGSARFRGVVTDSASGVPLSGARVELVVRGERRTATTGSDGRFQFERVAARGYRMTTLRLGFRRNVQDVETGARDTIVAISLARIPQLLDRVTVKAGTNGIFGIIGGMMENSSQIVSIADARVQVLGASRDVRTDSTGAFQLLGMKPSSYMVRVTAPGFDEQLFLVDVPKDSALETSRLLEPFDGKPPTGRDAMMADFNQRLRSRGSNSALVSGDELLAKGGQLTLALQFSKEVTSNGLRFDSGICLFIDGRPMPGFSLDAVRPERVATVEVYGASYGEGSGTLAQRWPRNAPCTETSTGVRGVQRSKSSAQWVVIWTKPQS